MNSEVRRLHPLGVPVAIRVRTEGKGNPVEVRECGEGPGGGRSAAMRQGWGARRRREGRKNEAQATRIEAIQEIWQMDDEWWRAPISRLYYRVVLENGRQMTLFRDLIDGSWYRQ